VLHRIIFITACAQNVLFQHKCQTWTLMQLANSTLNNMRPKMAHSLLMCHFSSLMYDLKMNTISVKYVTDFQ